MILSFSTKIKGKPTYFVEKIWKGLKDEKYNSSIITTNTDDQACQFPVNIDFYNSELCLPKLHTIRTDQKDRWKTGRNIDFYINARQKNMFRFAPQIPVVSTQTIYMSYAFNDVIEITIGGKYIYDFNEKEQLAKNDGFDSYEDFFNYFYPIIKSSENEFYVGKIIHWTNKRY